MTLIFAKFLTHLQGVGLIFVLSGVGVFADWALKVASGGGKPYVSGYFWLGAVVYMLTAFLWVPVMRSHKLAVLGAYYSVAITLLLAGVGILVFREVLSAREWAGIGCAIVSMVLMALPERESMEPPAAPPVLGSAIVTVAVSPGDVP